MGHSAASTKHKYLHHARVPWTSREGWLTCAVLPRGGASRSGRLLITLRLAEGKRAGNVQLNAALIFAAVCSSRCFYCEGPKNDGTLSCRVLKRLRAAAALERGRGLRVAAALLSFHMNQVTV